MPSKTIKQARFMAMCTHNPNVAQDKCPPKKVAKEFNEADKGKHFGGKKAAKNGKK